MADFSYIREHPWITVGAIAGGGFLLYLVLHKRSASATTDQSVQYTGTSAGVDPTVAAQLQAQAAQIQGNISGLTIQGQTQIALAQIGAGVQSQTVSATQDVTNQQTAAQLQLGLGTLGAQVAGEQINADVQMATINAIVQAFRGNNPVTNPTPTNTTPVSNSPGNPIQTQNPTTPVYTQAPTYTPPVTSDIKYPPAAVTYPYQVSGGSTSGPAPGGTILVATPSYAQCSPLDTTCVANNQVLSTNYDAAVATAQTQNNTQQLLANYAISAAAGRLTPAQAADYAALQRA